MCSLRQPHLPNSAYMIAIPYADEYPVLRCACRTSIPLARAPFQPAERNPCSRAEANSDSFWLPESTPKTLHSSMTCGYMALPQYALAKQLCAWANVGFSPANFLQTAMASSYCRAHV